MTTPQHNIRNRSAPTKWHRICCLSQRMGSNDRQRLNRVQLAGRKQSGLHSSAFLQLTPKKTAVAFALLAVIQIQAFSATAHGQDTPDLPKLKLLKGPQPVYYRVERDERAKRAQVTLTREGRLLINFGPDRQIEILASEIRHLTHRSTVQVKSSTCRESELPISCQTQTPMLALAVNAVWTRHPNPNKLNQPIERQQSGSNFPMVVNISAEGLSLSAARLDAHAVTGSSLALLNRALIRLSRRSASLSCPNMNWARQSADRSFRFIDWSAEAAFTNGETNRVENRFLWSVQDLMLSPSTHSRRVQLSQFEGPFSVSASISLLSILTDPPIITATQVNSAGQPCKVQMNGQLDFETDFARFLLSPLNEKFYPLGSHPNGPNAHELYQFFKMASDAYRTDTFGTGDPATFKKIVSAEISFAETVLAELGLLRIWSQQDRIQYPAWAYPVFSQPPVLITVGFEELRDL